MIIISRLTFILTTMEKWTTLEFITWTHNGHLCWMSSVDPSFPSFISVMNLGTANSVLGTFSERRLTNVIFPPSANCKPYSNEQAQFWKVSVAANFEQTSRNSKRYEEKHGWDSKGHNSWQFSKVLHSGFNIFWWPLVRTRGERM